MEKTGSDGLTKSQRYRLKDLAAYRKRKNELARSPAERQKRTEYMRAWREKNREKFNRQARESHRRNRHKHTARQRAYHLRKRYGIDTAAYQAMLEAQGGVCLICKRAEAVKRALAVDHCHKTGRVRGLLCGNCNGNLGWFEMFREFVLAYLG